MKDILSIVLNKSIHDRFNGEFFNQGSLYYAPYQRELCELEPLETLLKVYDTIDRIKNEFEFLIDFKGFIERKANESIVGEVQGRFYKDNNSFTYKIHDGKYVFFIMVLYKFSALYFQNPNERVKEIINYLQKEEYNLKQSPYSHIILKEFYTELSIYSSNNDIRDYINKSMLLLYGSSTFEFNKEVFKSPPAQEWFINTLIDCGNISEKTKRIIRKRGVGAKASAIYHNKDCKNLIFSPTLTLELYLKYLNSIGANLKVQRSMSAPDKVLGSKLPELIKLYKIKQEKDNTK